MSNKKQFFYNNNLVKNKILKEILINLWYNQDEPDSINGFELFNSIFNLQLYLTRGIFKIKDEFIRKLIMIPKHVYVNQEIERKLRKNDSHYKDNQIIHDLYEYYKRNNINFTLLTFDKKFTKALNLCNFNFVKVLNLKCDINN